MHSEGQMLLGTAISVATIAIQAALTVLAVHTLHIVGRRITTRHHMPAFILVMGGCGAALTVGHYLQVLVWAQAYVTLGVAAPADAYYLAFVNFTTLGYGDILPAADWRLLGPITAANGMLLFGWSTALMFAVLSKALQILHLT